MVATLCVQMVIAQKVTVFPRAADFKLPPCSAPGAPVPTGHRIERPSSWSSGCRPGSCPHTGAPAGAPRGGPPFADLFQAPAAARCRAANGRAVSGFARGAEHERPGRCSEPRAACGLIGARRSRPSGDRARLRAPRAGAGGGGGQPPPPPPPPRDRAGPSGGRPAGACFVWVAQGAGCGASRAALLRSRATRLQDVDAAACLRRRSGDSLLGRGARSNALVTSNLSVCVCVRGLPCVSPRGPSLQASAQPAAEPDWDHVARASTRVPLPHRLCCECHGLLCPAPACARPAAKAGGRVPRCGAGAFGDAPQKCAAPETCVTTRLRIPCVGNT